jgi:hypothetical protein
MTPFIDFCAAEWGTKVSVIKQAKNRFGQEYDPATDYWKRMREGLVDVISQGGRPADVDAVVTSVSSTKVVNYRAVAKGAATWLRSARPTWVGAPKAVNWTSGSLTVKVNPELLVDIGGQRHVIKLYLRAGDKLTKRRVDSTLHLLELTHGRRGARVGILDMRRHNLIAPTRLIPGIDALLAGEAAAFAQMWDLI